MTQTDLQVRRPRQQPRNVLVVGGGTQAGRISNRLEDTGEVQVVGYVDDGPGDPERRLGELAELPVVCDQVKIDDVLVALSRGHGEESIDALPVPRVGWARVVPRRPMVVVPTLFVMLPKRTTVAERHPMAPPPRVDDPMPPALRSIAKRFIDVVVALAALVAFLPVLAAVALAVKVSSPGPVLFRQKRIGLNGAAFSMLKFRSMRNGAGAGPECSDGERSVGPFLKLKDDPRVTTVGKVIRRLSIDELPQLWNVVRGDMSLVGPRPFVPRDAVEIEGWAVGRHAVRPGITGLWQVSGRNDLTFDDMCLLDHLYVHCWSVGVDLRILLRTVPAVVRRHGAY